MSKTFSSMIQSELSGLVQALPALGLAAEAAGLMSRGVTLVALRDVAAGFATTTAVFEAVIRVVVHVQDGGGSVDLNRVVKLLTR